MFTDIKQVNSTDCDVMKFVFSSNNVVAEAVLYKYPTYEERTVICCSTQSGCPIGCRFCGAGDYFVRSLTAEEIVFQVDHCLESQGIEAAKIKNFQIMVMSMGEPLLNFKELEKAFDILYVKYPQAKLLISTVGPRIEYIPVFAMAERIPTVGLQFSIHESNDSERNLLIPFEAKLTLEEISLMGQMFFAVTGRRPFINYCAQEHNSEVKNANELYELFDPAIFEATISVVCERDESIAEANIRQKELADKFELLLVNRGFSTRVFNPAGQDDIGGGCGQLWFVQDWMREHPEKAKQSKGFGKEIIHSPKK